MVGHGGSSAGLYLANPTSPISSHCASIVTTSTLRTNLYVLQNLEDLDTRRVTTVQNLINSSATIERNVLPILSTCIDGMQKAAQSIDTAKVSVMSESVKDQSGYVSLYKPMKQIKLFIAISRWQLVLCVAWCLIWWFASWMIRLWCRRSFLRQGVVKQHYTQT